MSAKKKTQKATIQMGISRMDPNDFEIDQLSEEHCEETLRTYLEQAVTKAYITEDYNEMCIMVISAEDEDGSKHIDYVCYQYPNDEPDYRVDNAIIDLYEKTGKPGIKEAKILSIKHAGESGCSFIPIWEAAGGLCAFKGFPHWPNLTYKAEEN